MGARRVPKGGQGGSRGSQKGGNEIQEDLKGEPKGGRRVTNGAGRALILSRRIPKGSKREAREDPKGGGGGPRRVRRLAKGTQIGEFDGCYTVS